MLIIGNGKIITRDANLLYQRTSDGDIQGM